MRDGLEGLQGSWRKEEKEGGEEVQTHTHTQRATAAIGTWNRQDLALMKSKGEQGDRQVFDFRESKVGSGAHKEEASREQAGGVIQATGNKRHGSGQCQEKGEGFESHSKSKFESIW